jgi:DNA-binding NarL/FixJ family response regulator
MAAVRRPPVPGRPEGTVESVSGDRIGIVVATQARLDREALCVLLCTQPDFQVLGATGTGQEALSLCLATSPRVLILGSLVSWPPDVVGVSTVRMCSPATRVLVIAPHVADRCAELNPGDSELECCPPGITSGNCLLSALAHGACGAIPRDVTADELFQAVRAVARGERWVEPGVELPGAPELPLSRRERAVALLIGRGSTNKDIANTLGLSEQTVKKHVAHILHKLELKDRLQLGLCVARHPLMFETERGG